MDQREWVSDTDTVDVCLIRVCILPVVVRFGFLGWMGGGVLEMCLGESE